MFPSNILLPIDAKYLIIGDFDKDYDPHWDITWSISYALTGTEHAFCTYLTESVPVSSVPGHYLGYVNEYGDPNGFLAIAFDTTGYFAVSSTYASGISPDNVKQNSIIIRNGQNLIYNQHLSALDSSFEFTETTKTFKILRFRVANAMTKLYVDYKTTGEYKNLLQIPLSGYNLATISEMHPVLSYSSPVSSATSPDSTIWLKNFNIQGNDSPPTYETLEFVPLSTGSVLSSFNYLDIKLK